MDLSRKYFVLTFVLGIFFLFGCEEDPINPNPPEDKDPAIALISPENNNFLIEKTESFSVTLQLADNEALAVFQVEGEIFDTNNASVSTFQEPDQAISGTIQSIIFTGTPPSAAEAYYKIKYTCTAVDSKGATASTFFWVSVIPPADPDPEFVVLEFETDSILNDALPSRYAYNFTSRQMLPTVLNENELEFDIAEASGSSRTTFAPQLTSPSNELLNQDSVFVMTDASRFNYDEATHETLYQAFFSDPAPFSKTPVLKEDDYVIVRLTKAPQPQFAIMRIKRVIDEPQSLLDRVIFDYKVTSQQ